MNLIDLHRNFRAVQLKQCASAIISKIHFFSIVSVLFAEEQGGAVKHSPFAMPTLQTAIQIIIIEHIGAAAAENDIRITSSSEACPLRTDVSAFFNAQGLAVLHNQPR